MEHELNSITSKKGDDRSLLTESNEEKKKMLTVMETKHDFLMKQYDHVSGEVEDLRSTLSSVRMVKIGTLKADRRQVKRFEEIRSQSVHIERSADIAKESACTNNILTNRSECFRLSILDRED